MPSNGELQMTDIPKPKTSSSTSSTTSVNSTDLEPTEEEKELMKTLDQREVTYINYLNKAGQTWKYKFFDIELNKEITIHTQVEPRDLPVTFKYTKDYCIPFLPIKGKERYRTIADRFIELIYELPDSEEIDKIEIKAVTQKFHSTVIPSVGDDKPLLATDKRTDSSESQLVPSQTEGSQSLTETTTRTILNIENIIKYICPTATKQEAFMFLQLCEHQDLDPFIKDAYMIKYGNKVTMVVSKDAFLKKAESLPDYEGFTAGITYINSEKVYDSREGSLFLNGI